jgi:hypothetical protein
MRTKFIFTVDTEISMGGAWEHPGRRPLSIDQRIFCKKGEQVWGVPLIADVLGRYGMKATFFCEMLASEVTGAQETERYVHYLMSRGQDVQLHAHPVFWFYARQLASSPIGAPVTAPRELTDRCLDLPPKLEEELLQLACERLRLFSGQQPVAFRAGGYAADEDTLEILGRLGITIDSSYNPAFRPSFPNYQYSANEVRKLNGVFEVPVTVFRMSLPQNGGVMPFEISAVSLREMKAVLEHAHSVGQQVVVAVFHSFSAVKPKDIFYTDFRLDRIVARRLEGLAQYLIQNSDKFEVMTFGELNERGLSGFTSSLPMAHVGLLAPVCRKAVQAVNRLYWV